MKLCLFVFLLTLTHHPHCPRDVYDFTTGHTSAYDQRPTDATLYANIYTYGHLPADIDYTRYDALIAVIDCKRRGQEAQIQTAGRTFSALVFDCAAPSAYQWMINGPYVLEYGYYFRQKYPELIGQQATIYYTGVNVND